MQYANLTHAIQRANTLSANPNNEGRWYVVRFENDLQEDAWIVYSEGEWNEGPAPWLYEIGDYLEGFSFDGRFRNDESGVIQ